MAKKRSRRNPSFIDLEDLRYFCQEKGFTERDFFDILTSVIKRTLEEKADKECSIEVIIEEDRTVRVFNLAKVVISDERFLKLDNEVYSQISFIPLRRARALLGERAKEGDLVRDEVFLRNLPWLASLFSEGVSSEINRLHNQRIKETYEELTGKLIKVTLVARTRDGFVLRNVESSVSTRIFLPNYDVPKGKEPALNEIFDVYVKAVDVSQQGNVRVIVSITSDLLLRETLIKEVPELAQGLIKIMATARSLRHNHAKVAVAKSDPESKIDPIGCFMGSGTSRLREITKILKGERLSVILWDEDKYRFICEALAPARVVSVIPPKRKGTYFTVIIPDEHHSMAIGSQGSNVALACLITNTSIDLMPLSKANEKGVKFTWNGNISQEELVRLRQRQGEGRPRPRYNSAYPNSFSTYRDPHHRPGGDYARRDDAQGRRSEGEESFRSGRRHGLKPYQRGRSPEREQQLDSYEVDFENQEMEMINAELERFQVDFTTTKEQPSSDLFEEALRLDSAPHNLQTRANTVGSQGSILSQGFKEGSDNAFLDQVDSFDIDGFNQHEGVGFEGDSEGDEGEPF